MTGSEVFLLLRAALIFAAGWIVGILTACLSGQYRLSGREGDKRDQRRKSMGLEHQRTPAPWEFKSVRRRVTAPSVLVIDSRGENHGIEPRYEDDDGMLVCEAVTREDGPLIAAAPNLLRALEMWQRYESGDRNLSLGEIRAEVKAALCKARGE